MHHAANYTQGSLLEYIVQGSNENFQGSYYLISDCVMYRPCMQRASSLLLLKLYRSDFQEEMDGSFQFLWGKMHT